MQVQGKPTVQTAPKSDKSEKFIIGTKTLRAKLSMKGANRAGDSRVAMGASETNTAERLRAHQETRESLTCRGLTSVKTQQ